MEYRWTYTGCDHEDQREIVEAWSDLQEGLDARLEGLETTAEQVLLSITHNLDDDAPPWEAQAVLFSPAVVLVGDAQGDSPRVVLEQAVRSLTRQLDQAETVIENGVPRKIALDQAIPLLERARAKGRMDIFGALLVPILNSLQGFARHELAVREIEEDVADGAWDFNEILDETLLMAWDRFESRDRSLSLHAWLTSLLREVVETAVHDQDHESLSRVEPRRRPLDEELSPDRWVERPDAVDDLEWGDLLPDQPSPSAWEELDFEDRQAGLSHALSQLPREQRQSLVLSMIYGFENEEIAAVQHLSPQTVQQEIDAARNTLSRMFSEEEFWPEFQNFLERRQRGPRRGSRRR